jgi:hypothetical protein
MIKNSKHAVANFEPRNYVLVTSFDHSWILDPEGEGSGEAADPLDPATVDEAAEQGLSIEHCSHCGSRLLRGVVYRHNDGDLAIFGSTCADRMGFDSHDDFAAARRERQIYIAGIRKLVRSKPEYAAVVEALKSVVDMDRKEADPWCQSVANEMLGKASRYYGLSPKQIEFAMTLPERNAKAIAKRRAREEADALVPHLEAGRQMFEGEIVSTKTQESQYGTQYKMLAKNDAGQKIWCTIPSKLESEAKHTRFRMSIEVEPSKDDPIFGFGKRPTKVETLAWGL